MDFSRRFSLLVNETIEEVVFRFWPKADLMVRDSDVGFQGVERTLVELRGGVQMRIVVDLNRCQAYAQCCFLAPSLFQLHGEEALFYDPAPDEARREEVLRAAAACPVQAIFVEGAEAAHHTHTQEPHG